MKSQTKEQKLIELISINARRAEAHLRQMVALVNVLKVHTKNRIAAHKAHTTMARSRGMLDVCAANDLPIPYVITKKGERMIAALEKKKAVSRKAAKNAKGGGR